MVVLHAEGLEDLVRSAHALIGALAAQPQEADVGSRVQASGGDEAGQLVVVNGQCADGVVVSREGLEGGREPGVFGDNLPGCLGGLVIVYEHVARDAPAAVAARAGLLRDREGDTLLERARDHGPLPVARAACDGEARGVDSSLGRHLKRVNDEARGPSPGHEGAGRAIGPVEVVEEALAAADGSAVLLRDGAHVEREHGGAGGPGHAQCVEGDDGRHGPQSPAHARCHVGVADGHREGDGAVLPDRSHGAGAGCYVQDVGPERDPHDRRTRRLLSELVLLKEGPQLLRPAAPVCRRSHWRAVDKREWIRQDVCLVGELHRLERWGACFSSCQFLAPDGPSIHSQPSD